MKTHYTSAREKTRELEKTFRSSSICLAKWYHANIYLQTGETHSCYHPPPHAIDRKAIAKNPAALHNTAQKLEERKEMLAGQRPKGCQYCWNIEDLGESFISDRHIRTGSLLTKDRVAELEKIQEGPGLVPDYIEVSFGNECNFRCGYCHPKASSRYHDEIKKFGPYDMVKNHRCDIDWFKIYREDDNPYLTAWWGWWEQIQDQLQILRVTGGEPLVQKSTYRLLERLIAEPKPKLELNINSNLGSSNVIVSKFCDTVETLTREKKIRQFKLFTSIDTWGPQAEFIRNGLKLSLFETNLKHYLLTTSSPVILMITFNIFSIPGFSDLLRKILEWRAQFSTGVSMQQKRILIDISYLKEPLQYDIQILPKDEFLPLMQKHLDFIEANLNDERPDAFSHIEFEKFRRIFEYMKTSPYSEEKVREGRRDFVKFFAEQDRRRGTNMENAFPELANFVKICHETEAEMA